MRRKHLRQLVVWQRLSVHLGWQCDNVRASYDEIPKATQDEVFASAKAFVKENKGRYECGSSPPALSAYILRLF